MSDFDDSETFEVHNVSGTVAAGGGTAPVDADDDAAYDADQFDELSGQFTTEPAPATATTTTAAAAAAATASGNSAQPLMRHNSQPAIATTTRVSAVGSGAPTPKRSVVRLSNAPASGGDSDSDADSGGRNSVPAKPTAAPAAPTTRSTVSTARAPTNVRPARTVKSAAATRSGKAAAPASVAEAAALPVSSWQSIIAVTAKAGPATTLAPTAASAAKQTAKRAPRPFAALSAHERRESGWDNDLSAPEPSQQRRLPPAPQTVNPSRIKSTVDTRMKAVVLRKLSSAKPQIEREKKLRQQQKAGASKPQVRAAAAGATTTTTTTAAKSAAIAALAPTLSAIASGPSPKRGTGLRPAGASATVGLVGVAAAESVAADEKLRQLAVMERELNELKQRMADTERENQRLRSANSSTADDASTGGDATTRGSGGAAFVALTNPSHLRVVLTSPTPTAGGGQRIQTPAPAPSPAAASRAAVSPSPHGHKSCAVSGCTAKRWNARTPYCLNHSQQPQQPAAAIAAPAASVAPPPLVSSVSPTAGGGAGAGDSNKLFTVSRQLETSFNVSLAATASSAPLAARLAAAAAAATRTGSGSGSAAPSGVEHSLQLSPRGGGAAADDSPTGDESLRYSMTFDDPPHATATAATAVAAAAAKAPAAGAGAKPNAYALNLRSLGLENLDNRIRLNLDQRVKPLPDAGAGAGPVDDKTQVMSRPPAGDDDDELSQSYELTKSGTYRRGEFAVDKSGVTILTPPPSLAGTMRAGTGVGLGVGLASSASTSVLGATGTTAGRAASPPQTARTAAAAAASGVAATPQRALNASGSVSTLHSTSKSISSTASGRRGLALDSSDVLILGVCGRGSSAVVYRAFHYPTLSYIALKSISIYEHEKRKQLTKELRMLTTHTSPHLIEFYGAYYEEGRIFLGLEWMDAGSLQDIVDRNGAITPGAGATAGASDTVTTPKTVTAPAAAAAAAAVAAAAGSEWVVVGTAPSAAGGSSAGGSTGSSPVPVSASVSPVPPVAAAAAAAASAAPATASAGAALSESSLAYICERVLHGLHALHSARHIHRDIKPHNILLNTRGEIKLTDFGILSELATAAASGTGIGAGSGAGAATAADSRHANTFIGTVLYMDPQRIAGEPYTTSADIWSFGMSIMAVALGRYPVPHSGHFQLINKLMDDQHLERYLSLSADATDTNSASKFSAEFQSFVASCVARQPRDRLSAEQLLLHPFIRKHATASGGSVPLTADLRALLTRHTPPISGSPAVSPSAAAAADGALATAKAARQPVVWSSNAERVTPRGNKTAATIVPAAAAAATATATSEADGFEFVYEESTFDESEFERIATERKAAPRVIGAGAGAGAGLPLLRTLSSGSTGSGNSGSGDDAKSKRTARAGAGAGAGASTLPSESERAAREHAKAVNQILSGLRSYRTSRGQSTELSTDERDQLSRLLRVSATQIDTKP